MLLKDLAEEFMFNCQCRKLSEKTVHNYQLQIVDCVEKVRVGMLEYMHRNSEIKETEFYAKQ